jgi:hypothetical protein
MRRRDTGTPAAVSAGTGPLQLSCPYPGRRRNPGRLPTTDARNERQHSPGLVRVPQQKRPIRGSGTSVSSIGIDLLAIGQADEVFSGRSAGSRSLSGMVATISSSVSMKRHAVRVHPEHGRTRTEAQNRLPGKTGKAHYEIAPYFNVLRINVRQKGGCAGILLLRRHRPCLQG